MLLMTLNTHVRFQAIGTCRKTLEQELLSFWTQHAQENGLDPDYAKDALENGGVRFDHLQLGKITNTTETTDHLCCCLNDRFPVKRNLIQANGDNADEEITVPLSMDSISDIVSSAAQFAVAYLNRDEIPEDDFNVISDEFLDALNAAGALDVPAIVEKQHNGPY